MAALAANATTAASRNKMRSLPEGPALQAQLRLWLSGLHPLRKIWLLHRCASSALKAANQKECTTPRPDMGFPTAANLKFRP
mmetsp:Transcript_15326/g.29905  ORF Transcript_15326/g.29905 Transcript_15326/m.29905 type:complete len:82 (-) Transcript_15326:336-581(-)